jgi:peptidoglycan/LPS O-acetylase OafA/YrhL
MNTAPYRPASETTLAWISIAFAILNFGLLTYDFNKSSGAITQYLWAYFMNGALFFVGYHSLRSRPKACAQQIAGVWFFVPAVVLAGDTNENIFAIMSLDKLIPACFSLLMLIWAIILATKQSQWERMK